MKIKFVKVAFVAAVVLVSDINVFNAQKSGTLSDVALANVEALADTESSEDFKKATDCEAVLEKVSCRSEITGKVYSYADKVS